jgi:TatD DNase family protein
MSEPGRDASANPADAPPPRRYVDIGANLTDGMFRGEYHGKKVHREDLARVLTRARDAGVETVLVTAGTLEEAEEAVRLAETHDPRAAGDMSVAASMTASAPALFTTVGVHPTRCDAFEDSGDPEGYFERLVDFATKHKRGALGGGGRVVAVGECGLDYDRLQFCAKETQQKWFARHFELARRTNLPMFLHSRAAHVDFFRILKAARLETGPENDATAAPPCVVHSFDGTAAEAADLISLPGVYIGINGCSLRSSDSLEVVKEIPLDRLMLETDAPWCGIKNTHPGKPFVTSAWETRDKKKLFKALEEAETDGDAAAVLAEEALLRSVTVKDRCEPCHIAQVAEVLAAARGEDPRDVAEACRANARRVFFAGEDQFDDD